jgi:site-specific DNA recombinase
MSTNTVTKQGRTAVIYARARASSREQARVIQAQLRACRDWAEKHGYTVAKEYVDRGKSTFQSLEKRKALKALLADTVNKRRSFDVIIYYSPDRLFRDLFEFEIFRARLEQEHVKLICVTDGWLRQYERVSQGAISRPTRISVS